MAKTELFLPAMGEGIIEATITKWLVNEGDIVAEDDPVVEVATDKVDTEIPAPGDGRITGIAFKEGETPRVGDLLAYIENEDSGSVDDEHSESIEKEYRVVKTEAAVLANENKKTQEIVTGLSSRTPANKYLSPLVRKIANEENIAYTELDTIQGSGMDGRITKEDIMAFINNKQAASDERKDPGTTSQKKERLPAGEEIPQPANMDGDEVIEMDRVRKLIAEHMVKSKRVSPHVTTFIDVDLTDIVNWRNRVKESFLTKEGIKLTLTPIFFEATARAIRDYPMVNISVEGTKIIKKKNINIGMATALPDGNLIVPVIKNADEKSLVGLARDVNDLAERARANRLKPDEISGGTFTITNYGTVGNLMGTPIINQPQAAILGIGAARKMPAVIETHSGDTIGIRQIVYLSLSYDHRVIDGALAGNFVKQIKDNLEGFLSNNYPDNIH